MKKINEHRKIVITAVLIIIILIGVWYGYELNAPQIDTYSSDNKARVHIEDTRVFTYVIVDTESANISILGSHGFFSLSRRCYGQYMIPFATEEGEGFIENKLVITANWTLSYTLSALLFSSATIKVSYVLADFPYKTDLDIVSVYNHTITGGTESRNFSVEISASPTGGYSLSKGCQYYVAIRLTVVLTGQSSVAGCNPGTPCSLLVRNVSLSY